MKILAVLLKTFGVIILGLTFGDLASPGARAQETELTETVDAPLAPSREDEIRRIHGQALEYYNEGEYERAIPLFLQSISLIDKTDYGYGTTNVILLNLAYAYLAIDKQDEAEAILIDRLERAVREVGPDHYHAIPGLKGLAEFYREVGEPQKSAPLYEIAIANAFNSLGPDNYTIGEDLLTLGETYEEGGNLEDAIKSYKRAKEVFEISPKASFIYYYLVQSLDKLQMLYDEQEVHFLLQYIARKLIMLPENKICGSVRRHIKWHRFRPGLRETFAHQC